MRSVSASTTTALTVVEPTSMPTSRARLVDMTAHPLRDVHHEVGGAADEPFGVGDVVHRALHLGVVIHVGAALIEREAGALERFGELAARLAFGFAECHLDARVRVDLA